MPSEVDRARWRRYYWRNKPRIQERRKAKPSRRKKSAEAKRIQRFRKKLRTTLNISYEEARKLSIELGGPKPHPRDKGDRSLD